MLFDDGSRGGTLGYEVINLPGGRYELRLHDPPAGCRALPMGLDGLPPALANGAWLVLCFAVWNSSDHESVALILDVCRDEASRAQVALLPFAAFEELQSWCPGATVADETPVWLVLRDGVLVDQRAGVVTAGELGVLVEVGS